VLCTGACADEPAGDVVLETIGAAGGLVSSHDEVLTLVFQPGALTEEVEIEISPSELPPPIFGPAYRVRPDIELEVNVEVTYRRVLPNDAEGVAVAAIRLSDYTEEMGYWQPLPRLSIDEGSGAVLGSDHELSLYYGMLESGGSATSASTTGPGGDPTGDTDPTSGEGCGDGTQAPGELCFMALDFPMAGGPVDVTLGDFDGSGTLDVATVGADGTLSVRLGDGTGRFGAETTMVVGMGPTALDSGDFDQVMGDDLVVTLGGTGELVLLQSQGSGAFTSMPLSLGGMGAAEVLVADATGDGVPDVMAVHAGSSQASFLPFMGGLGQESLYDTGMVSSPMGLALTQINTGTDANVDLYAFGGGSYAALPGTGTGFADSPVGGALGSDLRRAVGGALGGSEAGDAAVADFAMGGVFVLIGSGEAGTLASQEFYPTGSGAIDVAAARVTDDDEVDLVVANNGADTVTLLEKTGDSSWRSALDFDVVAGPTGIATADLDGDGLVDIVVSGEAGSGITVLVSDP